MATNDLWLVPFSRAPEPKDMFWSASYQEAFARLELIVEHRYLGLLTGEIGSGKSTLIRKLISVVDPLKYQPICLTIDKLTPRDFYTELLFSGGEKPPYSVTKAKRLLKELLVERSRQNDRAFIVIIDEAQDLSDSMLTELRFAVNHDIDSCSLFPLILVGQPELRRTLMLNHYAALAQRIQLSYHLTGLTKEQSFQYIRHRMQVAQISTPVFSESALTMLHTATQGIPRMLNQFARLALCDAVSKNLQVIDDIVVGRVLTDSGHQRKPA